jgi:hypothetical protein
VIKGLRVLALTAAVAATGVAGATTAAAKTGEFGSPSIAGAKPAGYLIVSATFSAANGIQTGASVACPKKGTATRLPQGGGAVIGSSSLGANINSSIPSNNAWVVDVNNNSGAATNFVVYAVCAIPSKKYQVVTSSVTNSAGLQTSATAICPSGTKVLGGGGFSSSGSLAVNVNTSIPIANGWRVDENNASAVDATLTAYAVCSAQAKTAHYGITIGTQVTNSAGTETHAEALCPSGRSALGGGGFSGSSSTSVNMNSTSPIAGGWSVYENNASASDTTLTPYVVCAS